MSTTQGFNADERAEQRGKTPIIIGGRTFTRVRSTNQLSREMRKLGREQERENRSAEKLTELIDAIQAGEPDDTISKLQRAAGVETADVEQLQDQVDEHGDAAVEITYRLVCAQLAEDGEHPDVEFVQDNLDSQDLIPLLEFISGSGSDPQVPATTPESSG